MAKIFNPTKSPFGVRLPGNAKAFIRPGETVDLDLDSEQLAKLEKRGCVVSEKVTQVSDTFAHEFIADLNRLQTQSVKSDNDGVLTNGQSLDLAFMTDDELRAIAKAKGLKLHHKTGRAKLIEALEL
jgi:hypothetical protein